MISNLNEQVHLTLLIVMLQVAVAQGDLFFVYFIVLIRMRSYIFITKTDT